MQRTSMFVIVAAVALLLFDCSPSEGCGLRGILRRCRPAPSCQPAPPCAYEYEVFPLYTHSLYCCIANTWQLRGHYTSYAQADQFGKDHCTPYGYRYEIVAYGTTKSGQCAK